MGLNDCYQAVRSNILMMNPLPTVSQASSIVLQEEQQRTIKLPPIPVNNESVAFVSQQRTQNFHRNIAPYSASMPPHSSAGFQSYPGMTKRSAQHQPNSVQCNYCKKLGHTIDKCYKLQRLRSERGSLDRNRRVAASVQQTDSGLELSAGHSNCLLYTSPSPRD